MFAPKYYNRYLDDFVDRQHYGARLKLKKFDTEEFQSLSYIYDDAKLDFDESKQLPTCIDIQNVSFHYNSFTPVLNNISLQVPQGKIYALLGSSGCGKTTLLRIILGRLRPLSGHVKIFGVEPASPESTIPGPGVGYMPQELALFQLLTIQEVLHYYGTLYGVDTETIDERVDHYINFLNLPKKTRKISQLSGGQQRRVSLAVTLIHDPPLLILDEPTVGVDSLLRCRIWNYLEDICKNQGTTILITTHYTEEARNAYRVGFIDSGVVLAQDNPERLITKYSCRSLEDVFLELCLQKPTAGNRSHQMHSIQNETIDETEEDDINHQIVDDQMNENKSVIISTKHNLSLIAASNKNVRGFKQSRTNKNKNDKNNNNNNNNFDYNNNNNNNNLKRIPTMNVDASLDKEWVEKMSRHSKHISMARLISLLKKNYIQFKRNPVSIMLLNIIPILTIVMFCVSFQNNPTNIPIAVVNRDNRTGSLSNLFISKLGNTVKVVPYRSVDTAIDSIRKVDTWLAVSFPKNFSRNFRRRILKQEKASQSTIDGAKIMMYPDNTHGIFALYTYRCMLDTFETFVKQVSGMMGLNPSVFGSPIEVMNPIYGTTTINYAEYMSPGMIICIVHGMTMLMGSFTIVRERNLGDLERGFVAGVTPTEMVLSHIIFMIMPMLSQVLMLLGVSFYGYQLKLVGSLIEAFIMTFLSAFQGLLIGVSISMLSTDEMAALILVFTLEMPLIFTSGTLYPLEAAPKLLHQIMMWNPLTMPIDALRNIMLRGWSFTHYYVITGVMTNLSYSLVICLFTLIYFRIMNHR